MLDAGSRAGSTCIGQIGVIASVDYALANYVVAFIHMYADTNPDGTVDPIIEPKAFPLFVVFCIMLLLHGLLNTFGTKIIKLLGDISVWWHVIGVAVIFVVLLAGPDQRQPVSYLFEWQNNSEWSSVLYVFLIGFLLAQYTITGFDASAHVSARRPSAPASTRRRRSCGRSTSRRSRRSSSTWGFLLAIQPNDDGSDRLAELAGTNFITTPVAHLPGGARFVGSEAARVHLGRRPVLLRHGLGHRRTAA